MVIEVDNYQQNRNVDFIGNKKGQVTTSHCSTSYPCYVSVLGDSEGASRIGLTRAQK